MPLHRHECESCGHRFRILVTHGTENDTPTCPICGSTATRRMMPLVAVQFKGSGFYKTDHGRKDRSRSNKANTDTDAKSSEPKEASHGASGSSDSSNSPATSKSQRSAGPKKTASAD